MKPYDKEQAERMKRVERAERLQTEYLQNLMAQERKRRIFKSVVMFIAAAAAVVLILLLAGCGSSKAESPDIQAVDGMVYSFIVGKVEGNDDLLRSILADNAGGILRDGRHAYPGHAEIMGERYEIVRYSNEYDNGSLFYKATFFRPSTGKTSVYNVLAINTPDGWRIAKNASIAPEIMAVGIKDEEGEVVHKWQDTH